MRSIIGLIVAFFFGISHGSQIALASNDFAVGIDLTSSYGYVLVINLQGTTDHSSTAAIVFGSSPSRLLAVVNGSDLYKNVMNQLSHSLFWPPRQYITYPRPDPPNTTVVAALAEMIDMLRSEVETKLRGRIPAAAITVPHLSQLYETILQAACDSIGLHCVQIFQHESFSEALVYHENALIAGLGLGVCQPFTATNHACTSTQHLPRERYYLLGYYADGIEAVLTSDVRSAYDVEPFAYADFSLGSRMRYSNPKEDFYWEEVRKFIILPLVGTVVQRPTKILLHGDKGADRKFKQVVNETLQPHFSSDEQPEWIESSIFTAAVGAAELAKRKPYWGLGP